MTAMAKDINASATLLDLVNTYHLPTAFKLYKNDTSNVCGGPVNLSALTTAVVGELCLRPDAGILGEVSKGFRALMRTDMIAGLADDGFCSCFCECAIYCMAFLILAPLCCEWPLESKTSGPCAREVLTVGVL